MQHTVLLVDDEPKVLSALKRLLRKEPYEILTAGCAAEAAVVLENGPVDLIVCDEQMPGMPGSEFLAQVAREYPDVVRIILTGHPTLASALRAINEGRIYQYLTKPCNELDLLISMRRALEQKDLVARSQELLLVTRQQSVLIDEACVLRRLPDLPTEDRTGAPAKQGRPTGARELLEEIDQEVARGKALLENFRRATESEV
jgi:DNA-binding NtrC family response regulator